jgi:hypothetical protein
VEGGELAHEQQRRADVLVQEGVDLLRSQVGEATMTAASVVDDEDVERA